MASLPQMPDVAGESKAAADKAAKAAQEAAAEAARKSKEAYDLVIPAEIDWSKTIYPQPVKDGLHSIQSGIGKGVNMVGDAASTGVGMVGNAASSGVGMVGNAAGAVGGAVSGTPRAGGGGSWMPTMGSANLETRTADEVGKWLEANSLGHLKPTFSSQQIDGAALSGLVDTWKKDPIGFATHAEKNLGCKVSGDSFKLGNALNKVHFHDWSAVEAPKPAAEAPKAAAPAPAAEAPKTDV